MGTPKVWRGAERQTHRQARLERHAGRQTGRQAGRHADRRTDGQTGRQADRETGEETDDRGGRHKRSTCTINSTTIQTAAGRNQTVRTHSREKETIALLYLSLLSCPPRVPYPKITVAESTELVRVVRERVCKVRSGCTPTVVCNV